MSAIIAWRLIANLKMGGAIPAHCEMKYSICSEHQAIGKLRWLGIPRLSKIQISRNYKPERNSNITWSSKSQQSSNIA
jgi:hypothetical protein